jgi:hypothetical protein
VEVPGGGIKEITCPVSPCGFISGGAGLIDRLEKREMKLEDVPGELLPKKRRSAKSAQYYSATGASGATVGVGAGDGANGVGLQTPPTKKMKIGETPLPRSYELANEVVSCFSWSNR